MVHSYITNLVRLKIRAIFEASISCNYVNSFPSQSKRAQPVKGNMLFIYFPLLLTCYFLDATHFYP